MAVQRFTGTLEAARGGGALVLLPAEILTAIGGVSRMRVTGTLDGVGFESSTIALGEGRVGLGVHKATRLAAAVEIGDSVEVEIERDTRPRELTIPDDLAAALATDTAAAQAFERLAFTHRREYVRWITGAERDATRATRVAKTLAKLLEP